MKIRLMKAAISDLREVRAYIATDDPKAAEQVAMRLEKAITLIAERPAIGRPAADHPVREWSVSGLPFVIPYRLSDDTIEIIRVFHTSRRRPQTWQ
jgi:plasmid stabilization system protein ParE